MKKPRGIRFIDGGIATAGGFSAGGVQAKIKPWNKRDVGLIVSGKPCAAAGAFTTNRVRAACVDWNRGLLPCGAIRAVVCNSGNANACTGKTGVRDVAETARLFGRACAVDERSVLVASTGVIGRFMPMEKIRAAAGPLAADAAATKAAGRRFAESIMTTDLKRKECAVSVTAGGRRYTVGGCAKGSGMIHPNMATMLAFITTDARIAPSRLDAALKRVVDRTFNNLTVDGDTSTNDMVLVLANGCSGAAIATASALLQFEEALFQVCNALCAKIAEDGEGATKRVEVRVKGGTSFADARKAAKAVAGSNLVKTAVFGNDPNWGRISCAVGYSGAQFSESGIRISLCGVPVFKALRPLPFKAAQLSRRMKKSPVIIDIDLGAGPYEAVAHTCDLTYGYIKINAEYTT